MWSEIQTKRLEPGWIQGPSRTSEPGYWRRKAVLLRVAKQGKGKVRGRQDLAVVSPRLTSSWPIVHGWPQQRSASRYCVGEEGLRSRRKAHGDGTGSVVHSMVYSHVIRHWLPGRALPWTGTGAPSSSLDYGLEKEWKAKTILLAHTVKAARTAWLQLQTLPAGSQTELTIDDQLQVSPPPPVHQGKLQYSFGFFLWTNQLWQRARKQTQLHIVAIGYSGMSGCDPVSKAEWMTSSQTEVTLPPVSSCGVRIPTYRGQ